MTTAKQVILTAIHQKGVVVVKKEATKLAENVFCSRAYVLSIVRGVERGIVEIINRV